MTQPSPIPPGDQPASPIIPPPEDRPVESTALVVAYPAADAPALGPILAVGAVVVAAAGIVGLLFARRSSQRAAPVRRTPRKGPVRRKPTASAKPSRSAAPAKRKRRSSSDDKTKRGPQDASRIAMSEDYEVRYWTKKFGVDRDALQRAVDTVGNGAAAVERHLGAS